MTQLNGVEFTRTGNPQADLVAYAKARGISQTEAKAELEAEFGVAKAVENQKDEDVVLDTTTLNGVEFTRTGDPQADLETYAAARGISESEAKAELEAEFGVPTKKSSTSTSSTNSADSTDEADDTDELKIKPDENAQVAWFGLEEALEKSTEPWMVERIYRKLNDKLQVRDDFSRTRK